MLCDLHSVGNTRRECWVLNFGALTKGRELVGCTSPLVGAHDWFVGFVSADAAKTFGYEGPIIQLAAKYSCSRVRYGDSAGSIGDRCRITVAVICFFDVQR